jgi:LacI family repressor for deo operon, udp, cdd, tsx, nupC, and nupG
MASRRSKDALPDRIARIGDVAAAAGVSTATVSRALAFPDRLRPATLERVLCAVRQLGYTPNEAARALRAGATRMVLVVAPYLYSGAFFAGIINSIDAELAAEGYTMIVGSLDGNEDKARRLVDLVFARQLDGVITLTERIPLIDGRSLLDAGVPIVSICTQQDAPGLPTVLVDDEACAVAQTRHLTSLGIGVLITDHNVEQTLDIVDRAYIIYDGRVLFAGSPEDLVADANVRRLYLGEGFSL